MRTIGKKGAKQYVLGKEVGKGSYGCVYLSPPYAIK
jgi:hypothetical protein